MTAASVDREDDLLGLAGLTGTGRSRIVRRMKAALQDRYGPPAEVVRVVDVERPTPGPGELLVRVHAASINRADLDGLGPRPGFVRLFTGLRAPRQHRMGLDVAGVVEEIGPGVTRFRPGTRVFADLYSFGSGAFAEYATAPERAFQAIPDDMSFEDAATLPHSAILAVQGLRRRDGSTIKAGDKVLISGASGNVGPFAVQIAKSMGAQVTGVCRTEKVEFVRSLGADQVIDYMTTDYTRAEERYDWIVDTDSHYSIRSVRRVLKPNGVYVTLGGSSLPILSALILGPLLSLRSDKWSGLLLWWKPFHQPDVDTIKGLIAEGKVRPRIDRTFPLDGIVDALRYVDQGRPRGKVVIAVATSTASS
jgi:NADPH:quinone reductase-like Zn-dependent oxidoreductase